MDGLSVVSENKYCNIPERAQLEKVESLQDNFKGTKKESGEKHKREVMQLFRQLEPCCLQPYFRD